MYGCGQGRADLVGPPAGRQGDQHHRSAGPLDQGQHRRGALAQQQVAFPMARNPALVGLGRPLADRDGVDQLAAALGEALAARVAHGPTGAQATPQLTRQRPTAPHIQAEVDGLVGDPHG